MSCRLCEARKEGKEVEGGGGVMVGDTSVDSLLGDVMGMDNQCSGSANCS